MEAQTAVTLNVQANVTLAPYTTLGVGGPAQWFVTVRTEQELEAAVRYARANNLPMFVLGGGSNLVVSDAGYGGLVVHIALKGIRIELAHGEALVTAGAGEDWDALVQSTVERNYQGMECLAGIPGTVGGTPVQNVGAYGQEIARTLVYARCFDTRSNQFVELQHDEFGFGYRTSLLNTAERGRYIVSSVTFALKVGGPPNLSYADLKRAFAEGATPSLPHVAEAVRAIRRKKGMVVDSADPDSRSAGSFFRNPIVDARVLDQVAAAAGLAPEQTPNWPAGPGHIKLPAAWLLEHAGFVRGYALGNAGISSKHTLAIVNRGEASEKDIAALRTRIVDEVQRRFGITLEQEPVNVG